MSAPQLRPRPSLHRLDLALLGYAGFTIGPFLASLLLLYAIAALTGEAFAYGWILLAFFAVRQVNIFLVSTLYHRSVCHRAFRFHPKLEWSLRGVSWFLLGAGTRTWALVHRKHHALADTADDPHSPSKPGENFWTIGRQSFRAFYQITKDDTPYDRYTSGLPDDALERFIRWDERRLYGTFGLRLPLFLTVAAGLYALAGHGLLVAILAAVASLPATNGNNLAGTIWIVNGVGHTVGYRNYALPNTSTNLLPIDLLGWGEALHENHHARPGCADMAVRRWEWDPAYAVLWCLSKIGLVTDLRGR